jgi:hypothetical protein
MKSLLQGAFSSFVNKPGRNLVFTCVFYALWLVIQQVESSDQALHSFKGRMIGIATLQDVNVGARVSLFYKSILVFFGAFLAFISLAYVIFRKREKILLAKETQIINYVSLVGIFLFLFKVFESDVYETLELIYFLHKLLLFSLVLRSVIFRQNNISVYLFAIITCVSFACYFFIADIFRFAGAQNNPDFYITAFIVSALLLIGLNMYFSKNPLEKRGQQLPLLLYSLQPLIILPLLSILKDEIYLVLKANHITFSNALPVYIALMVILISFSFFRLKKGLKKEPPNEKEQLSKRYFPWLIFSMVAYIFYNHTTENYDEMFESGNVYLPLMEYKLFGTLSPVEKLNTHLLSDYFFSSIYVFFNGLKVNEITLYDFLLFPISYSLYYFLIRFITKSEFIAVFCLLLFPFAEPMLPEGFCFAVLALFSLVKLLTSGQTLKNYFFYCGIILFLVLWRIDIGYTIFLTMPLLLLFYHFRDNAFRIQWKLLFRSIAYFAGFLILVLGSISLYRHINLFDKFLYFINYCFSAQSYGYHTIGSIDSAPFKMHYFIFPALVIILIIVMVVQFNALNKTRSQRITYLSILFICAFYLVNFNRGLIRHSLAEGGDGFTSSFIYIILPAIPFLLSRNQSATGKSILFFSAAFILISVYRVPTAKGQKSTFEKFQNKITRSKPVDLSKIYERYDTLPGKPDMKHKAFSDFIKKNTKPDETFIDFSNRPMLYFFAKKPTPSWFYQNPLCIQNDFLQDRFISDLQDYRTPYLVFSGVNDNGFDKMDNVPNCLRHYKMAEYFYNHFKPYVIVDNLCIWKRIDIKNTNQTDTIFKYRKSGDTTAGSVISTHFKAKAGKAYSVKIVFDQQEGCQLSISSKGNTTPVPYRKIDEGSAYALLDVTAGEHVFDVTNATKSIKEVFLIESDHYPDYFSGAALDYHFEKLPYVWGTYDKILPQEKILFEHNTARTVEYGKPVSFPFPGNIDRSSGNTLVINCKNHTSKQQQVSIFLEDHHGTILGGISFSALSSEKEERYAIRISSIYKWYSRDINRLIFKDETGESVEVTKLQITKGK